MYGGAEGCKKCKYETDPYRKKFRNKQGQCIHTIESENKGLLIWLIILSILILLMIKFN
jgi:hypothetical protein